MRLDECTKCGLCKIRTQVVLGRGSKDAEFMFVGEAPGKTEDEVGRPFVGKAGIYFKQIVKAIGIKKYYVTNLIMCRPHSGGKNRPPFDQEIEACSGWLDKEIRIINPKVIITLGKFATESLTKLRGIEQHLYKFYKGEDGRIYYPMLHPATILYDKKRNIPRINKSIRILKQYIREVMNGKLW